MYVSEAYRHDIAPVSLTVHPEFYNLLHIMRAGVERP